MARAPLPQVPARRPEGPPHAEPAERERAAPTGPKSRWGGGPKWRMVVMAGVAAVALTLDQLTKSLAEHYLANGPVHLVGSLSLVLTYNRGAAFSLAQGLTGWLIVIGVLLVVVLLVVSRRLPSYPAAVAVGLMLGGAVGNLSDRLLRGDHGAVVDFIASRYWPTFNLADVAIVTGALLLVVVGYRRERRSSDHRSATEDGDHR